MVFSKYKSQLESIKKVNLYELCIFFQATRILLVYIFLYIQFLCVFNPSLCGSLKQASTQKNVGDWTVTDEGREGKNIIRSVRCMQDVENKSRLSLGIFFIRFFCLKCASVLNPLTQAMCNFIFHSLQPHLERVIIINRSI